jgi:hypothetical protein
MAATSPSTSLRTGSPVAALGFTIKSGWTAAVVVTGTAAAPRIAAVERVEISDPEVPESKQPYHEGFGTARGQTAALRRLVTSVERYGAKSVGDFIQRQQTQYQVCGAGLIVGSLIDPATIGNDHIRIHALEGQLFREVVRNAAGTRRLDTMIWRERDVYGAASAPLGGTEAAIKTRVAALGQGRSGPWRAEHKLAAVAALLMLARSSA